MNLLFVVDDNYIDQMLVTLRSIFLNHVCEICVYVVTDALAADNRRRLKRFVEERGGRFCLKDYQDSCIDTREMVNSTWAPIVYYKLYGIFGLSEIDRVLYLDCDVIVDGDLTDFYEMDLEGYYGAVIEDTGMEQVIPDHELHFRQLMVGTGMYFNGGVMLLNLAQIRKEITLEDLTGRFERYADLLVFNEQDLLNMVWSGRLLYADKRYNRIATDFYYRKKIGCDRDAVIYHYTANKPWTDWQKTDKKGYGWCVGKYLKYCRMPETKELYRRVKRLNRGMGRRLLWRWKSWMGYNPFEIPDGESIYVRFLKRLLFYRG